jgi:hypothetical protein
MPGCSSTVTLLWASVAFRSVEYAGSGLVTSPGRKVVRSNVKKQQQRENKRINGLGICRAYVLRCCTMALVCMCPIWYIRLMTYELRCTNYGPDMCLTLRPAVVAQHPYARHDAKPRHLRGLILLA